MTEEMVDEKLNQMYKDRLSKEYERKLKLLLSSWHEVSRRFESDVCALFYLVGKMRDDSKVKNDGIDLWGGTSNQLKDLADKAIRLRIDLDSVVSRLKSQSIFTH